MKTSRSANSMQNKQMVGHKPKPEIRDDLDSREGLEQLSKKNHMTTNEKETKRNHLKKKK